MKRILLGLAIAITALTITPQKTEAQDFSGFYKADATLANATTNTTDLTIALPRHAITLKFDVTKNSGTVAGTIVLSAKATAEATEAWMPIDTITLADATRSYAFALPTNQYLQYRALITTTGTQNSTWKFPFLWRKLP